MNNNTTKIVIGKIVGNHGIKGDVKLQTFTEYGEDFFDYPHIFDEDGKIYKIKPIKEHQNVYLVRIEGVDCREEAKALAGTLLYTNREDFKELEKDEFYFSDIIGLPVIDEDNHTYGTIVAVEQTATTPYILIQTPEGKKITAFLHHEAIIDITKDEVKLRKEFILL